MAKTTLLLLLVSALAVSTPGVASASVARFETTDIVLQADRSYDSRQGLPNPFVDVTLTAQVTSPSGRRYTVTGFFDGDGNGGAAGRVFKIRLAPDETGTWTWTTASNQASLHGKSGSFQCAGTSAAFPAGPVEVNPERPRSFRYRDGKPVYLIGKFLDVDAPAKIRFSHTLFSEKLTDTDRQALLDRHLGMRLNKINVYLANRGDYSGVSTTPWVGTATSNDKTRFDLTRWHLYERWVRRMRGAGMVAHLWFFADDSGFGDLPDADRRRLIQYGMARLSGYANTMFTLVLEWQEGWTPAEVQAHAEYLHQQNPWDRLASVHGVPGEFSFPGASWADYMDIQAGNEVGHDEVYAMGLLHLTLADDKPLIQEEHGLGTEDGPHRRKAWAAFMAGAGGSGTGGFLEPLARFISTLPFERMEPSPALGLGDAWALSEPGQTLILYLPNGGSVTVDLTALPGTLLAEWLDPRTGSFSGLPDVQGGGLRTFSAPGADDWTLILRRPITPGEPPPSDFYTVPPCRLVDTRQGEALRSGQRTRFVVFGACEIPSTAKAVAVNLTSVAPTASGLLALWPGDQLKPVASSASLAAGRDRANNAVLTLGEDGTVFAEASMGHPSATAHLVIDVSGYFE